MPKPDSRTEKLLEKTIFASRWLQAPLYVGLIVAQGIYVYQFFTSCGTCCTSRSSIRPRSRTPARTSCSACSA
jgi:uncharacterized membrane protein YqhA